MEGYAIFLTALNLTMTVHPVLYMKDGSKGQVVFQSKFNVTADWYVSQHVPTSQKYNRYKGF